MQSFVGESEQIPPMYSALKKDGKRLYELPGKASPWSASHAPFVSIASICLRRRVTRLVFRVACSKGTYIRVLVEDIAKAAGTVAHTARLHREVVGDFNSDDMLDLSALEAAAEDGAESVARSFCQSPDIALAGYPPKLVTVSEEQGKRFQAGMALFRADSGGQLGLVRVYAEPTSFLGLGEARQMMGIGGTPKGISDG